MIAAGGGDKINQVSVVINSDGIADNNAAHTTADLEWMNSSFMFYNAWKTNGEWSVPISCTGGGEALSHIAFHLATKYVTIKSCSTVVSGNTRTVSFAVTINPIFTSPPLHNLLIGSVGVSMFQYAQPVVFPGFDIAPPSYSISVTKNGTGVGTFTMTDGGTPPVTISSSNINCGGNPCTGTESVPSGATRVITAIPTLSTISWSGGCTSTSGNDCILSNITTNIKNLTQPNLNTNHQHTNNYPQHK
jgi:hypothetical protein